jgi:hypothetical protein
MPVLLRPIKRATLSAYFQNLHKKPCDLSRMHLGVSGARRAQRRVEDLSRTFSLLSSLSCSIGSAIIILQKRKPRLSEGVFTCHQLINGRARI